MDGRNGREKEQREEGNRCIHGSIGNSGKDLGVKEAFMELTLTPPGLVAAIARSLPFPRCYASSDAFGQGKESAGPTVDNIVINITAVIMTNSRNQYPQKTVTDIFCNVSVSETTGKKIEKK